MQKYPIRGESLTRVEYNSIHAVSTKLSTDIHPVVVGNRHLALVTESDRPRILAERWRSQNHQYWRNAIDLNDSQCQVHTLLHYLQRQAIEARTRKEPHITKTLAHLHSIEGVTEETFRFGREVFSRVREIRTVPHQRFREETRIIAVHKIATCTVRYA